MSTRHPISVHVLYEHTVHPHSSSYIRLLQPLTHPRLDEHLVISTGVVYEQISAEIVIVDRMWHPKRINLDVAKDIVNEIRIAGANFIYALDDNFFDIPESHSNPATHDQLQAVEYFLRTADMVWVTTGYLAEMFKMYNTNIQVMPNCLDERLVVRRSPNIEPSPYSPKRRVIGYMGTKTHDGDLLMVLPALKEICERHPDVEIQIIGVSNNSNMLRELHNLPVRIIQPDQDEDTYPNFMLWFTNWVSWDIAIAPLVNSKFNRAKSDIKFLDYAVVGAAGIFSDVLPYQDSVVHQKNGLMIPNQTDTWVEALETLLDDELRISIARNAQEYVFTSRTIGHQANKWLDVLTRLRDE